MSKIFFTSDTFFGRTLKAKERGFSTSEEMDDILIDNWNQVVGDDDIVFHLGNFSWDPISAEGAIIHLKGNIRFVGGSYDKHLSGVSLIQIGRHHLLPLISYIPKQKMVLSHWPLMDWDDKDQDTLHIHGGKLHHNLEDGYRFNANCDKWGLKPIELETLKDIIESKKSQ
jgi:calcineurin-like phosphoesterase family protein